MVLNWCNKIGSEPAEYDFTRPYIRNRDGEMNKTPREDVRVTLPSLVTTKNESGVEVTSTGSSLSGITFWLSNSWKSNTFTIFAHTCILFLRYYLQVDERQLPLSTNTQRSLSLCSSPRGPFEALPRRFEKLRTVLVACLLVGHPFYSLWLRLQAPANPGELLPRSKKCPTQQYKK